MVLPIPTMNAAPSPMPVSGLVGPGSQSGLVPTPPGHRRPTGGLGMDEASNEQRRRAAAEDPQLEESRLSQQSSLAYEGRMQMMKAASQARIDAAEGELESYKETLRSQINQRERELEAWETSNQNSLEQLRVQLLRLQQENRATLTALALGHAKELARIEGETGGYERGLQQAGTTTVNPYAPGGRLAGQTRPQPVARQGGR